MHFENQSQETQSLIARIRSAAAKAKAGGSVAVRDLDKEEIQTRKTAFENERDSNIVEHLKACGLEEREYRNLIGGLRETSAVLAVRKFAEDDKPFLLLMGGVGVGKTLAASEILLRCRKQHDAHYFKSWDWDSAGGQFVTAHDVARLSYYGQESREKVERLSTVKILVLDDLGAELMSEGWRSTLDAILNRRYRANLKTAITTNLGPEEFKERYGNRLADRIREEGVVITCGSESLRKSDVRFEIRKDAA